MPSKKKIQHTEETIPEKGKQAAKDAAENLVETPANHSPAEVKTVKTIKKMKATAHPAASQPQPVQAPAAFPAPLAEEKIPAPAKKTRVVKTNKELPAAAVKLPAPLKTKTRAKPTPAPLREPAPATEDVPEILPATITPTRYEDIHFVDSTRLVWNYSLFSEADIRNFQQGTLYNGYEKMGAHKIVVLGQPGYYFAVWAPNATSVSVIGHFNAWKPHELELLVRLDKSGIWEGFVPGIEQAATYKFHITGFEGLALDKGDPYANYWERRPNTASVTWDLSYNWQDDEWMAARSRRNALDAPWTVYEVHLASWMRPHAHDEESYNSYEMITERLVPYVQEMGFTHVELMPVMEHPFDGSWGYQGTGYFAPTSRFGTPQEFMAMIDAFHQAGIGVLLDWVPSHFPYDMHGLFLFDGAHTYEYADMRKGYHPDWESYIFNYKRGEVKSFLISSARYWFDRYHIDGMRVDAVSSMLKLNYSRKEGEWEPNEMGGDGNLEAIAFLKDLNATIYRDFPDVQMIAEESSDWPGISKPVFEGGIGFGMKWMMGWMHDTLNYFKRDTFFRKFHQDQLTFSMAYFHDENFMLPLSHDEVVHGKSPMLYKMPGDEWQQFANLRLLYSYMMTHPGGKLLFMGNEFGATEEWNYKSELQWYLLQYEPHRKLRDCVIALLHLVRTEPAFYQRQFHEDGFEWIETAKRMESVLAFRRKGNIPGEELLVILNLTPVPRHDFVMYATGKKLWKEIFNSDDPRFYGTGDVYNPSIKIKLAEGEQDLFELTLHLPPLAAIVLK